MKSEVDNPARLAQIKALEWRLVSPKTPNLVTSDCPIVCHVDGVARDEQHVTLALGPKLMFIAAAGPIHREFALDHCLLLFGLSPNFLYSSAPLQGTMLELAELLLGRFDAPTAPVARSRRKRPSNPPT
ncbi:MAG: hypothetical protein IPG04_37900 [Polyangiaceae bacterium]|nr:hypothetical protein [Polyangiaceae bacterium]